MSIKNFQIKNGLSVNGQEVIDGNANGDFTSVIISGIDILEYTQEAYNQANTVNNTANTAQSAFNTANGANGLAVGAYNQANVTIGVDATQNTRLNAIETTNANQNTAITLVNQFTQSAYNQANTDYTTLSIQTSTSSSNGLYVPVITVSANGRVTAISNTLITTTGGTVYTRKTTNSFINNNEGIIADTSAGSFTITLPSTPTVGNQVVVADGNNFATNNLTIARNGSTIEGIAEDLILDIQGVLVTFIYDGSTWEIYTQVGAQGGVSTSSGGTTGFEQNFLLMGA